MGCGLGGWSRSFGRRILRVTERNLESVEEPIGIDIIVQVWIIDTPRLAYPGFAGNLVFYALTSDHLKTSFFGPDFRSIRPLFGTVLYFFTLITYPKSLLPTNMHHNKIPIIPLLISLTCTDIPFPLSYTPIAQYQRQSLSRRHPPWYRFVVLPRLHFAPGGLGPWRARRLIVSTPPGTSSNTHDRSGTS